MLNILLTSLEEFTANNNVVCFQSHQHASASATHHILRDQSFFFLLFFQILLPESGVKCKLDHVDRDLRSCCRVVMFQELETAQISRRSLPTLSSLWRIYSIQAALHLHDSTGRGAVSTLFIYIIFYCFINITYPTVCTRINQRRCVSSTFISFLFCLVKIISYFRVFRLYCIYTTQPAEALFPPFNLLFTQFQSLF